MAGSSETTLIDPASMSATISAILDDCLYNIISDTVLKQHREEKQARMQSAAIIAQQAKDTAKTEASPGGVPQRITTAGAIIDEDDRIYLHENPLRTTTEVLCPTCRLPRLQHPTTGKGARAADPAKEYCSREPYIDKDGCDIYGKSLTLEKGTKKKAAKKEKEKAGSRSGSESPGGSPNGKDTKPTSTTIPSGKCPYCPRYMTFNRIAQHMDRCMGLNSRQASKNATSKLQSNTPQSNSRQSTPKPSLPNGSAQKEKDKDKENLGKKRKLEGSDDEGETTPAKKKKILLGKKGSDGKVKALDRKVERVKTGDKRIPEKGKESEG